MTHYGYIFTSRITRSGHVGHYEKPRLCVVVVVQIIAAGIDFVLGIQIFDRNHHHQLYNGIILLFVYLHSHPLLKCANGRYHGYKWDTQQHQG
jgi:hypothetical protein